MENQLNDLVILESKQLKVILTKKGASIYRIIFDNKDMLLSPVELNDFYRDNVYFGKTVGRVCGRIVINNKIILHGGENGLSNKDFDVVVDDNKATFKYLSLEDKSSKGKAEIIVTYELKENTLVITHEVHAIDNALIYLTNHAYFSLGGAHAKDFEMKINSDEHLFNDEELVPQYKESSKIKFDFHEYDKVLKDGDIDNYFYLKDKYIYLRNDKYQLEIITDYCGANIYTDNFHDDIVFFGAKGSNHRAVAIEPQDDQFDRKELASGHSIKRTTSYIFTKYEK